MADTPTATLILHGWGGNKAEHWQEHLSASLRASGDTVWYPKMPEPTAPNREQWLATITDELAKIPDKITLSVVAHSLGAISWMHIASRATAKLAERVLLVAPPYVMPEIPPLDAPPGVSGFFPPPMDPAAIGTAAGETSIIASDNDDYATYEQTAAYAELLKVNLYKIPGAGHISPYWGYGEWPWIHDWCLHRADLPPQPKAN